jgi:S-adenosylmethionine hydrolase
MPSPVVALLTDFGVRDHYVGTMKGVILGVCPEAALVDITHDVAPQDIAGASIELAASYRYFPAGTIFLVVVDPGVGSDRRALAVAAGGWLFVAPDNGVLSPVLHAHADAVAVELTDPRYARSPISRTFAGRDRFAPAAAWLARGTAVGVMGPTVDDAVRLALAEPRVDARRVSGVVIHVDRFGNLITNIDRETFDRAAAGRSAVVDIGGWRIRGIVGTYADAPGMVCALFGSTGCLEVAEGGGSAARALRVGRGAEVQVDFVA